MNKWRKLKILLCTLSKAFTMFSELGSVVYANIVIFPSVDEFTRARQKLSAVPKLSWKIINTSLFVRGLT